MLVLGILRECLRLGILEPFARQYLYYKEMAEKGIAVKSNAQTSAAHNDALKKPNASVPNKDVVNHRPKGMNKATWKRERSAVRFAEQGWQFAYYIMYWPYGMVSMQSLDD